MQSELRLPATVGRHAGGLKLLAELFQVGGPCATSESLSATSDARTEEISQQAYPYFTQCCSVSELTLSVSPIALKILDVLDEEIRQVRFDLQLLAN